MTKRQVTSVTPAGGKDNGGFRYLLECGCGGFSYDERVARLPKRCPKHDRLERKEAV